MRERPIIFSTGMVYAILDGRKTQTRRPVKPQPAGMLYHIAERSWQHAELIKGRERELFKCPYWGVGTRLWVRETFALESCYEVGWYTPPFDDGRPLNIHNDPIDGDKWWEQPHYKATDPTPELEIGTGDPGMKWSPSIYMPRWASRITLEILEVRVERVQEISEEDARAEGVCDIPYMLPGENDLRLGPDFITRPRFARLWDSLNAKRGLGWTENPWCWCISFRRIE